ncbi:hypothetical protein ACFLUO_03455 [Chloroflexota bacterium]
MEKWISMVETFCTDPSREKEFNDFYNNTHLPDVLKTPGFMAARRYAIKESRYGRGKYLTIFEIETDDIDKTIAIRHERREQEKEQGRAPAVAVPGLILPVWRDIIFKQIHELTSDGPFKTGNWINTVELLLADPSREKEFNDAYNNTHLPDILNTPGYLAVRRFIYEEPRNGRGKYLAVFEIETDDIDKTMATRRERREQEKGQGHSMGQIVPNAFIPFWHDIQFKKIYELSNK